MPDNPSEHDLQILSCSFVQITLCRKVIDLGLSLTRALVDCLKKVAKALYQLIKSILRGAKPVKIPELSVGQGMNTVILQFAADRYLPFFRLYPFFKNCIKQFQHYTNVFTGYADTIIESRIDFFLVVQGA